MSIINEALKKTEEQLQRNTAKNKPLLPKPSGRKAFLLYTLILLSGLLLGKFIFALLDHKPQGNGLPSSRQSHKIQTTQIPKKNADAVIQTINPPPLPALPSLPPEEKKPAEASFVLNGIFFSDNYGYALINNQIVRKNDYVDGAKVGSITANTVQLDNAGQKITLSTQR